MDVENFVGDEQMHKKSIAHAGSAKCLINQREGTDKCATSQALRAFERAGLGRGVRDRISSVIKMQQSVQKIELRREMIGSREKLEQSADINLDHLWRKAQDDFLKVTNRKLDGSNLGILVNDEVERLLSIDDPLDEFEPEERHGLFHPAYLKRGFAKAKNIFKTVFQVLWKFSGFLMPVAATIPIVGSGMSFLSQAIQILIDTTKSYRAIFAKAAELFEQVGFFSMRFEMLMEAENEGAKVHPKFVQFLNVILAHTVDCVALYIKLTQDAEIKCGGKSKTENMKERMNYAGRVTKQFVNTMATGDDGTVEAHLSKLRSLVEEEHKLSSALVLSTVLKIHTNVIAVRGDVNVISGRLETMQSILGEYKNLLGPSKTDELRKLLAISGENWSSRFRTCAERRIPGTGRWLLEHKDFTAWLASSDGSSQLLAIEADSDYGKTYLATAVIVHIRQYAIENQRLDMVAFYLFDKSSKSLTFGDIVRTVIFQLCIQSSQFFAIADRLIQSHLGRTAQTSSAELWSKIVVHVASQITDTTCFVVLDGLEHLDQRVYQDLRKALGASTTAGPSLRILLTGNATSLRDVVRAVIPAGIITLDPQTYLNRGDLALVATNYLAECDFFQEQDSEEMEQYMIEVRDRLVQTVSGDYYILSSRVGDMRRILSRDEIEEVLGRVSGQRHNTVEANLFEVARRSSEKDLIQLKEVLYLLAILDRLDMPMPQLPIVQQYITRRGGSSNISRPAIITKYPSLLKIDDHDRIGLATSDIAAYLLGEFDDSDVTQALSPQRRDAQLKAIHQLLKETFVPSVLRVHGLDDRFFSAKLKQSDLGRFAVQRDAAMATLVTRLIDCLSAFSNQPEAHVHATTGILALMRAVVVKVLLRLNVASLGNDAATELGSGLARLFFEEDLLGLLWPVGLVEHTTTTWGSDDQLSKTVYHIVKNKNVLKNIEERVQSCTWLPKFKDLTGPGHLKIIISRMIATQWLQGRFFWTREDVQSIFKWFSSVPELGLVNMDVNENGYDKQRTRGLFTPPNWRKIEAWVKENIHIHDRRELDIQSAAVLCMLGDQSQTPSKILLRYTNADLDWRALLWMADATAWQETGRQYDYVNECLDTIFQQIPERSIVIKAMETLNEWMGHWSDDRREFQIRERIVVLGKRIPGVMTHRLLSVAVERAVRAQRAAGLDFFKTSYESNQEFTLETLVYEACNNFMHIALSQTLAEDTESHRISFLSEAYRRSLVLCGELPNLSDQARRVARMKLSFWLGRLYFVHPDTSKLKEAIEIWEKVAEGFVRTPTMGDVEIILPVTTFLCSAYIRDVLAEPVIL
ncbi:hypothetical protein BDU57DRAFT_566922 [Ampelomyces quisqualis]|uniref:Uncharacterized protein n=1 Tax=Ampelomyces quisqualis TaxID=50730 RepID=A0A6A5QSD1_AMPQU|nr:hypothetical protein BDU57DRAFT_566922 [Ampelomyces quisqualis]